MKNLLVGLFLVFLGMFYGFGQQRLVVCSSINDLVNVQLPSGTFEFKIPNDITPVQVDESASYYSMYFTIAYDQSLGKVTAVMNQNDAKTRHIFMRFFVTLDLIDIDVESTVMSLEDFYQMYLD